jgi:hypothetical protein
MNLAILVVGVVLTQVGFITLVRKVHDRSIQQALARWFVRYFPMPWCGAGIRPPRPTNAALDHG